MKLVRAINNALDTAMETDTTAGIVHCYIHTYYDIQCSCILQYPVFIHKVHTHVYMYSIHVYTYMDWCVYIHCVCQYKHEVHNVNVCM